MTRHLRVTHVIPALNLSLPFLSLEGVHTAPHF
jgi:hypothetical protein